MDIKSLCNKQTLGMKSSMIRELVEMTKGVPGLISFAGGFPSPKSFPGKDLADIFYQTIVEEGEDALQYGSSGGDRELKEAIVRFEDFSFEQDEIHISNGATNGIYYALRTFIEPGDCIVSESPSFLGSLVCFEAIGAEILPVSMDGEGINTDELEEKINQARKQGKRIKMIYTIPDFQNPSGITMSRKRREELIRVAIENNIIILEDDPYSRLRYTGENIESLGSISRKIFADKEAVITVRSFSKLLGPGLRIAYVIAGKDIIAYMNSWSQKINVTTERIAQKAVTRYLNSNLLPTHIEKIVDLYKPLRDKMISMLYSCMPENISWTKPDGGMFIWIDLPEGENSDLLFEKALEKKVAYIPGSKFYPTGHERYNGLRLNFSYPTAVQIEVGIHRLAEVFTV